MSGFGEKPLRVGVFFPNLCKLQIYGLQKFTLGMMRRPWLQSENSTLPRV